VTAADALGTAALVAGLLMAVAPVLQVRRMLRTQSSRDFSLGYPSLITAGLMIWLAYGLAIANPPMIISNAASITFMLITIGVALHFRRVPGDPVEDVAAA